MSFNPFTSQFLPKASLIVLCVLLYFPISSQEAIPPDLNEWIEEGMRDWNIPGMAVGIVKDGEIIYARGFGEKKLNSGDPVNQHTLFGIASVSKNMTAAALAILVDEGKLHWDDRITDHIPWFELSDPWVSSQVTVRDLLTHRVGVGRMLGNRLQFMTSESRDEVLYRMRYMDFEAPFRYQSVYSNVMYSLAGQLIEYIEGVSWDEFLMTRLFGPLGMTNTLTSITQIETGANIAHPHQEIKGELRSIQWRNWDNAGPAGGVISSVYDVCQWLLMQLGDAGKYRDTTLISTRQMNSIHRPQIALPSGNPYAEQASYGLGWRISDYQGVRLISHGGATDGFNTSVYMAPEHQLGIVVVTNTFNLFREALSYTLIDALVGIEAFDWHEHYLNRYRAAYDYAMEEREKIHAGRIKDTRPAHELNAYLGTYYNRAYGEVRVYKNDGNLIVRFWGDSDLSARLEHWHKDTYRAIWYNPAQREEFCWFTTGKNGKPDAFHFEFNLRPILLQAGAYPSNYTRVVTFEKTE